MMGMIWVVLLVALTGSHLGHCSPLRSTPQTYPHDAPRSVEGWGPEGSVYAAVPALALVLTAVGLLFGCTWCYRHKDCKPNEGADNQLFTASATHLHDGRRAHPPDSGFSEPVNNNISEDNNNGPISLREMQNIANNNAAAYIVSENEERNRVSRESVVEFEPLPTGIRVADPLEHCADWFGDDDFPRDQLQYLREIGRGWFGRVVEGEIEDSGATTPVAVKILNQNASLEDKARFLDEARMYRDVRHENVLAFLAKCLQEEPWILLFELCSMDLQQYLVVNRPKMAILNDSGVPLRIMCDVTAALAHLHSRGYLYGSVWSGAVQVRGSGERARAVLGRYCSAEPPRDFAAPETRTHPPVYTASSDLWSLGTLVWEVCAWGAAPTRHPPPLPDLPCPYRNHLYQVMQLCWNPSPEARPTSAQVHALIHHLYATPRAAEAEAEGAGGAPARHSADFEQRWQRLKPNNIPTRDEHRALVHAHAHAHAHPPPDDALGAVSRSSSIMSDKEPLDAQIKSESLTNLHGSLEDVRNIYLTHNELAALDCHQGNIALDDAREREQDRSDASVDPWLKDIIAGSQDDVSYYKDVSDVIKNLDNILNSEKTSSSESSHQASPSRDNLSLDCKKDYPMQSSMVKSPGITNFQNILDTGFSTKEEDETGEDDEIDRDTIGTLSHSFERHSEVDTTSQHTLENLTPDTPIKDVDIVKNLEIQVEVNHPKDYVVDNVHDIELPNEIVSSVSEIPKLKELCVASIPSASDKQFVRKDCQTSCDSNLKSTDYKEETKSIDDVVKVNVTPHEVENKKNKDDLITEVVNDIVLPKTVDKITSTKQESHDNLPDVKEDSKVIDEGSMTNDVSIAEVLASDLIKEKPEINCLEEDRLGEDVKDLKSEQTPVSVQNKNNLSTNTNIKETETPFVLKEEKTAPLPPEIVQNKFKEENDVEKAVAVGNIIPDDTIAKESIVKQEASDEIIAAEDMTEEDLISDHEVNDYEKNTVSEVTEYTKWINCASTPERVQEVSDISRLKHDLIAKRKHARHEHTFKSVNDNDFEVIIQKECLEAPVAESLKISDSKDFLEDPLVKDSLKEGNEVLSEEMTGEIEIPVKESELVDTAEINYSTKQDENDFFESKLITETPSTSEKCEHTLIEVTETISDNSDNDLTEIIGNNKSDLDYINLEKQANKPLVLVPSFPMKSVKDDLGFKNTEIKENSIGTVTKGKVNIVFEEPSVYKSIELDQDIVTGEDDSDKSPVKELTKFQQYISVDSTDKPVVEQLEHISDVHSAEKPIIKQLQVTDDILEQLQRIGEVHSTEKRIVEQPQHTSDVHTIEEPIIEQLLHTSVVHSTEKPIVEELEHTDVVKSTEKLIVEELQHTDEDNSTQISIVETLQYTDVVHLTVKPIVHEQQHTDVAHSTEELIVKEQQHTDVIHSTEKPIVEELPHTDVVHSTEALIVEELQHTDVVHSTEKPIIEELPHTDVVHSTEALIVEELQHTDVVHSTEKPIVEELPHTDVVHSTEALIVEELQHTDVVHSIEKPIVEELPHTDVVHSTEALIVEEIKHTDVVHSTEKPIGEELQHTDVVHSTEEPIIEELQQIDVANSTEKPIGEELQLNSDGYSTVKELQHVGHSTVKPVVEERKHTGDFHSTEKPVVEQLVPAQIEQPMIEETILDEVVDINATDKDTSIHIENKDTHRSEDTLAMERSDDSTAYMDLINNTNSEILTNDSAVDKTVRDVIKSCLETSTTEKVCYLDNNESTEYLDLPSFGIKDVDNFLHMEKVFSSNIVDVVASTPLTSDTSANTNNTLESSVKDNSESQILFETKVPNYGPGVSLTKLEQKYVPDSLSPFESPTKSHPTDTYDENSSVVLGPFENCTLDLFKGVKSTELVDLPKEELLAFSSNFSDINLETPSPLRDGNFLNEVPDIIHDDLQFDDVQSLSEKPPSDPTETESINSGTEKRVSPSTPPNSPGIFLASTSQQKYVVDIDLTPEVMAEPDLSLQKEIELNQIELQITSKLAMAENENNMNIEYSGPLTVEGLVSEEGMMLRESDALPESYLAGNGGSMEDLREDLTLDEECVKALRNELELKLPLAQVAAIEPPCESTSAGAWSGELPPPPELVLSYPGALSPIAEETGQQLSAYENDIHWNLSTRTDSSESYPEPCNNSTDEVTELPTGANSGLLEQSTYTIHSRDQSRDQSQNNTYTLHRDIASSREITMSADSLNASPFKKPIPDPESPIDDKTYTKEEEKESLERISQVSPFLLSPTTDTSAPDNSDNLDNATGVSTLSKTTLPTDAKLSKPSETQCLSKATSIDSWCSNDTLYNVEENFDDLAMDPEVPDFEPEKEEGNSESTDTLTHNEDEKEASHCSTYIIHDSKSEICETFSPDSITANDNYTYTKAKTENAGTTPSVLTTELNDSTKNTQTKDLAYGTLMSGLPSYSNCTTDLASGFDDWKVQQPELVRKSPMINNGEVTPSNASDEKVVDITSPHLDAEPSIKRMESVDISCLQENLTDNHNKTEVSESQGLLVHIDSPNYNYKNMAPSITSTPITDLIDNYDVETIPMILPEANSETVEDSVTFQTFLQSAEVRPQDLSSNASNEANQDTEILLEGDSKTLSRNSNRDSLAVSERTPTYSDFENSAISKPQDVNSKDKSSQSNESGISSADFQKFESLVRSRPQDLSSLIDASSLLLKSERMSSELAMGSIPSDHEQTSQETNEESQQSPPNVTNLNESHSLVNFREPIFLLNFDADDETEQPHSIIITETTMEAFKESPNRTYDTDKLIELNQTYDTQTSKIQHDDFEKLLEQKINGEITKPEENKLIQTALSPRIEIVAHNSNTDIVADIKERQHTSLPTSSSDFNEMKAKEGSEKFATVNFLNETFEELIESNVDDSEPKEPDTEDKTESLKSESLLEVLESPKESKSIKDELLEVGVLNGVSEVNEKLTTVTEDFLQNEKKFCQFDTYLPLLSDIRFTGPASEIMSTSFTQESPTSPTEPTSPTPGACTRVAAADIIKEWDSDSDSHTSNSSSGEFIWKDGDGHETAVVPTTHFDHQRTGESQGSGCTQRDGSDGGAGSGASDASGDSGSGSEGDEVEFVPSSWDCRAAPAKSSLRSLEQATPVGDNKKRVVFKRQKYHCVYEYPREAADLDAHSPAAYLPDLSTYSEWDPSSVEEAELGYGQLFGAPSPLDLYPLRAGIAFGADYDEDFFISSSARPFESLGIMTSQFFPGKHVKPSLLERDLSDDVTEDFPPPPSPLPTTMMQTRTPSLDFTTPDSGVEDITPGSTTDEDFKKKLPESELTWRPVDSGSSSESVSPSSPGGEALGGLRHTRDKLKLDLPPSPHIPSPRHNRVFNFVLDKPKRRDERTEMGSTPLVMTDDTPIVTTALPLNKECEDLPVPEPTFSTFGKSAPKVEPEQKLILTDEVEESTTEVKDESPSPKVVEAVKGEGTVLDSGDEDSGIESSSKATLERNKTNVS